MTEQHMTDRQLDEAIDAVAREMMAQDAPAAFRAQVIERVAAPAPAPVRGRRFVLATAAVVVVVAAAGIAVWMLASSSRTAGPQSHVASGAPGQGASPAQRPPAATPSERIESRGATPSPSPGTQMARNDVPGTSAGTRRTAAATSETAEPAGTEAATLVPGPPPLGDPAPIIIRALEPDALAIGALEIAPLDEIQPIPIPAPTLGAIDPQRRPDR